MVGALRGVTLPLPLTLLTPPPPIKFSLSVRTRMLRTLMLMLLIDTFIRTLSFLYHPMTVTTRVRYKGYRRRPEVMIRGHLRSPSKSPPRAVTTHTVHVERLFFIEKKNIYYFLVYLSMLRPW